MKKAILYCLGLICFTSVFGQTETDSVDVNYLEDQIYVSLTYNILNNKPKSISQKGFSGGTTIGFIKDLPFNEKRNVGIGVGVGYNYNVYIDNLKIDNAGDNLILEAVEGYKSNRLVFHAIEFPIEFRWRTSTPTKYRFWRIYAGVKGAYLFSINTKYRTSEETIKTKNLNNFNKFQYGLMLSAGYSTWNIYVYYALSPIFKNDTFFENKQLDLKELNIGIKFYIM